MPYTQSFGLTPVSGNTPYGVYDNDPVFVDDCAKTARWIARKLGHPFVKVELDDGHLYGAYEEAALKYNCIITTHQATNWFLDYIGSLVSSSTDFTSQIPESDLSFIRRILEPYSRYANLNSKIPLYSGSFILPANTQTFDLKEWARENIGDDKIVISEIFHFPTPAMKKIEYYGFESQYSISDWLVSEYNKYSVPLPDPRMLQIFPVFSAVLREQQSEMLQTVRRSLYTYTLHNNVLRITPVPTSPLKIWFTYYKESKTKEYGEDWPSSSLNTDENKYIVTSIANVPLREIAYSTLNPLSKDWIRRYALATAKEILGNIRSKFASIPIPGGDVSLDGGDLKSSASEEKSALIEELNTKLEELSIERLLEKRNNIQSHINSITTSIPFPKAIYVG